MTWYFDKIVLLKLLFVAHILGFWHTSFSVFCYLSCLIFSHIKLTSLYCLFCFSHQTHFCILPLLLICPINFIYLSLYWWWMTLYHLQLLIPKFLFSSLFMIFSYPCVFSHLIMMFTSQYLSVFFSVHDVLNTSVCSQCVLLSVHILIPQCVFFSVHDILNTSVCFLFCPWYSQHLSVCFILSSWYSHTSVFLLYSRYYQYLSVLFSFLDMLIPECLFSSLLMIFSIFFSSATFHCLQSLQQFTNHCHEFSSIQKSRSGTTLKYCFGTCPDISAFLDSV